MRLLATMLLVAVMSARLTYEYCGYDVASTRSVAAGAADEWCMRLAMAHIEKVSKGLVEAHPLRTIVGFDQDGKMAAYVTGEGTEHSDDGKQLIYQFQCQTDNYDADSHIWRFAMFTPSATWGTPRGA